MKMRNYFDGAVNVWHETGCLRLHDKYIAVKSEDKTGERNESIIIPSEKWPLNSQYEVFHYRNTGWLPTDEYPEIAEAFDAVEYRIGYCYDNTYRLVSELKKRGITAKPYVGWLFTSGTQYPIHHCWCVVKTDDGGKHVLDLCDDCTMMVGLYANSLRGVDMEKARNLLVDFYRYAKENGIPNTRRCIPLGQPFPLWVYVGSPCEPEKGRQIFQSLTDKYPRHESVKDINDDGLSGIQQKMAEVGLIQVEKTK